MPEFCHLHLHSEYSLLEGACRVGEICRAVKDAGQTAAAITDRASMSGCVGFYRACKEAGVRPIIGAEVRVSAESGQAGTLVLLCTDARGYANLCVLLSALCTADSPRAALTPETLRAHAAGLIALSGGAEGEIFALLDRGDAEAAEKTARTYAGVFGRDNFYIELQNHGLASERRLLSDQYALARKLGLPAVATNDVKYLKKEDAAVCRALRCIKEGTTLSELKTPAAEEYYLKTADEMEALFGGFDGALENTVRIAERCRFDFDFSGRFLPAFPLPEGKNAADELRALAENGMRKMLASGRIPAPGFSPEAYRERTDYELGVIGSMGYDDYFLIVADYVGFAKNSGIPVGPGRGSGCGSLVAFLTGITDVDPLAFGLYFERFLNPERVSMPDIDIDFDSTRRDEMLAYVKRRYGRDCVCQIITFGTMAARAALRDSCRIHGAGPVLTERVMSLLPGEDLPLGEAVKTPKAAAACGAEPDVREIFSTAMLLEGLPRNVSVHAAGVIITDGPVSGYVPLTRSGDAVISQYDMDTVASLGLLKFDFLALRYLTVIRAAEDAIRADRPEFDPENLPADDPKTFAMLRAGRTAGVFQLESGGITSMLRRLRPETLGDLIDTIALYRPGPMDAIPGYIRGKQNPASVRYPHPLLEPVLKATRGCIVYQEQVMSIFRILAGYTAGHADVVRRAMSKKKAQALEAERGSFVSGASERGMSPEAAGALFDSMTSFAGYAFNQSHAVAYGMITYRTAYLKANYPGYYLTALMNVSGSPEKMGGYAEEAAFFGLRILPPDINRSGAGFRREAGGIRYGLGCVKGSGPAFGEAAAAEAGKSPFVSLHDFLGRMPPEALNRRACEAVISAGAFDFTGLGRASLLALLDTELGARAGMRSGVAGQMDIFSFAGPAPAAESIPEGILRLPDFPEEELRRRETELCGLSFRQKTRENPPAKPAGRPVQNGIAKPAAERPGQKSPARKTEPASASEGGEAKPAGRSGTPAVFIRVSSRSDPAYGKCVNLAEIFEGGCPLVFYFSDTAEYVPFAHGIDRGGRILGFFAEIVGKESVISRN